MPAVLFGSISTLADTSELQRDAFNAAFRSHGLDWDWDRETYRAQLDTSGGQKRIAEYAAARGVDVDAAAVHATKSEIFQQRLAGVALTPRPGVTETIAKAREAGFKVALVTTTSAGNVAGLLSALEPHISRTDFDTVIDVDGVERPKPDAAAYQHAVELLGEPPSVCVAVEDNVGGVASAAAAGISCVAFPNENTAGHTFDRAVAHTDALSFGELRAFVAA